MTSVQKNQVAAMNARGMSIDEILLDTKLPRAEVEAFIAERKKRKAITPELKKAVIEWWQSGHSEGQTAKKFSISQSSVHRIVTAEKEKEPASAPTETSSVMSDDDTEVSSIDNNSTDKPKSQALRGVEVIGLMQTMLISVEESFGDNVDIISLRADSEQAHLMFRYGGKDYVLSFGLAF